LINENIAVELVKAGAKMVKMNTSVKGFGPNIVEINHSITTDLNFSNEIEKRSIIIRALVSKECNSDIIIGLPPL
jgi:dihydroorotate dehydrogenase